jgi:hypothetical protein
MMNSLDANPDITVVTEGRIAERAVAQRRVTADERTRTPAANNEMGEARFCYDATVTEWIRD